MAEPILPGGLPPLRRIPKIDVRPGHVIRITGFGRDEDTIVMVQDVRPNPDGSTTLGVLSAPARWPDTEGGDDD